MQQTMARPQSNWLPKRGWKQRVPPSLVVNPGQGANASIHSSRHNARSQVSPDARTAPAGPANTTSRSRAPSSIADSQLASPRPRPPGSARAGCVNRLETQANRPSSDGPRKQQTIERTWSWNSGLASVSDMVFDPRERSSAAGGDGRSLGLPRRTLDGWAV